MRITHGVGGMLLAFSTGLLLTTASGVTATWIGRPAPELHNQIWINSAPLRLIDLRGKVLLLEFWTFG